MPASIDPGDRKLLLIGGAILLVLTAGLAFVGTEPQEEGSSIPSTYSSGSGGARAAYLLLQELHYNVSRWERSPTELPSDPEDVVLILADPLETPTREEREALQQFVDEGELQRLFFRQALPGRPRLPASFRCTARRVLPSS